MSTGCYQSKEEGTPLSKAKAPDNSVSTGYGPTVCPYAAPSSAIADIRNEKTIFQIVQRQYHKPL